MSKKRIYLSSPHIGDLEKGFVKEAFKTNWIAPLGPNVDEFEKEIAKYVKVSYAAALVSGTAAIHMALKAIGIKEGDMVFCSTLTFSASCNPIIYEKGIPVFIDSEKDSWNMCPKSLEKAMEWAQENKTIPKAVIVVHLYGQPANMDEIVDICKKYNVPIIEDAAESLGATYKNKQTGSFGEYGVYSFNGNKIITTSGGGMLVSDNKEKITKVHFWATQAKENKRYYEHKELGYNYRLSNIVAGIGRGQIQVLDERIKKKKWIFEYYKEAFKEINELEMQPIQKDRKSNYWLSCMTISKNSKVKPLDIILALENENIEARNIWNPMHKQPYYKQYKFFKISEKAISEDIFERGICLPSDTKNSEDDMKRVVSVIRNLFK